MLRVAKVFPILLLLTASALSQSFPETDALLDVLFAKDVDTVLRHLPPRWEEVFSHLPRKEREALAKKLLPLEKASGKGETFKRADSSDALIFVESGTEDERATYEVYLAKRISDGYESMLRFAARGNTGPNADEPIQVLMRFEEGEWRIQELQSPDSRTLINLADTGVIEDLRNSVMGDNERSAVMTLQMYVDALQTYHYIHENAGYPAGLDQLALVREEETGEDAEPKPVLGSALTTSPYEKDGYRFTYHAQNIDSSHSSFTIVARPVSFGNTGTINFFVDNTGMHRYTREDREATADDRPLYSGRFYGPLMAVVD